jgi:NADH pyrophosphatase NudC (nudix superfamily)
LLAPRKRRDYADLKFDFLFFRTETVSVGEGDIAQELEDARWFTLDEAKQAVSAALATDAWLKSTAIRLPPSIAIAHQLVKAWVDKQG